MVAFSTYSLRQQKYNQYWRRVGSVETSDVTEEFLIQENI